jgi:hypothetical protein
MTKATMVSPFTVVICYSFYSTTELYAALELNERDSGEYVIFCATDRYKNLGWELG